VNELLKVLTKREKKEKENNIYTSFFLEENIKRTKINTNKAS